MELKAGTVENFNDSMAAAIEKVFEKLWSERYGTVLPEETRNERRLLLVSIAQGVIKYLSDNALDSFDVEANVKQIEPLIQSSADTELPTQIGTSHKHKVTVTQENIPANKVESKGEGKGEIKVNILTTGELYS